MSEMASAKEEFLVRFIDLYKSHECLWNTTSEDYNDIDLKDSAYEELLLLCREIDRSCSMDLVKKKIMTLKNSWQNEMRKVVASQKSETGENVYVPKSWFFERLMFLKPQEPHRFDANVVETDDSNRSIIFDEPSVSREIPSTSIPPVPAVPVEQPSPQRLLQRGKRSWDHDRHMQESPDNDRIQREGQSVQWEDQRKYSYIGAHWADKLNELDPRQRIYAEKLITDIFFEAERGRLGEGCSIIPRKQGQVQRFNPPPEHFPNHPFHHNQNIRPMFGDAFNPEPQHSLLSHLFPSTPQHDHSPFTTRFQL